MDLEEVRNYLLSKRGAEESLPFDEDSPVYKAGGKIFAILSLNPPLSVNLKCDPEKAIELRERYGFITPGYHMNKKHWNTVNLESHISDKLFKELADHSYQLIFDALPNKIKDEITASED
ncbi:MAG: MmcQ/YjbR family DNA-binding protein [Ignavibacteriaceae bacterium]|nr:MmcQ/YjbR family DNA-binding protein [Ignavibacteriaceae bacterium]